MWSWLVKRRISGFKYSFSNKGKRADELVQVLKKIWTDDVVEFKGTFYSIPTSKIGPKAIEKPSIPIYLGFVPNTFTCIAKYADGWLAQSADLLIS
jgi:alkanesulfonate monooxygenase SsuD/methylene tetrahydromethanopterin reductase-like flavin-dependent oxidoreductase (luciferase family)